MALAPSPLLARSVQHCCRLGAMPCLHVHKTHERRWLKLWLTAHPELRVIYGHYITVNCTFHFHICRGNRGRAIDTNSAICVVSGYSWPTAAATRLSPYHCVYVFHRQLRSYLTTASFWNNVSRGSSEWGTRNVSTRMITHMHKVTEHDLVSTFDKTSWYMLLHSCLR